MCVKRGSFRHKGISVPLGRLPGFAVITVPSRRKGEKRLWLDCRQIWTLIKLPSANTGIPSSFSARSKRVVCRVWCFFFCGAFFFFGLRFIFTWDFLPGYLFNYLFVLPPEEGIRGSSIPGKISPTAPKRLWHRAGLQPAQPRRRNCSLWTCPFPPSPSSPSPPSPPPHPTGVAARRLPRDERCEPAGSWACAGKATWAVGRRCYSCFISPALWSVTFTC